MRFLCVFILGFLFLTSCNSSKQTTSSINHGWIDVAVVEDLEVYVDTLSIGYENGYSHAWIKTTYTTDKSRKSYTDKIRSAFKDKGEKLDKKVQKWDNFYYNISYRIYDCANKRYKVMVITDYTRNHTKIITTKPPKGKERWTNVGIDTMGDFTLYFVCDYGN